MTSPSSNRPARHDAVAGAPAAGPVAPAHHPVVIVQRSGWALISLVLLLLLGLLGWSLRGTTPSPLYRPDAAARTIATPGSLGSAEQQSVAVFQTAAPSVVGVRAARGAEGSSEDTGAGVVWDREGYVVTNVHLVRNAEQVLVRLLDGSSWPARLVGCDDSNDIALVKIEAPAERLPPIPLGRSENLLVGQQVYAIGSPFGLDHTLTSGLLSGRDREILSASTRLPIYGVLQTDAAINPGNSGGPLLDSSGRMIGLNTAVAGEAGTSVGVGFAVPADTLNRVVPELMRQGRRDRAGLGIRVDPDGRTNDRFLDAHGVSGVVIYSVQDGGAAERAGLRPTQLAVTGPCRRIEGDLIHAVDGVRIHGPEDLRRELENRRAGEVVQLGVTRFEDDHVHELRLSISLQALPPERAPRPLDQRSSRLTS